jgi:hypothetical protein
MGGKPGEKNRRAVKRNCLNAGTTARLIRSCKKVLWEYEHYGQTAHPEYMKIKLDLERYLKNGSAAQRQSLSAG